LLGQAQVLVLLPVQVELAPQQVSPLLSLLVLVPPLPCTQSLLRLN
jgi:hypothetical protein